MKTQDSQALLKKHWYLQQESTELFEWGWSLEQQASIELFEWGEVTRSCLHIQCITVVGR